LCGVGCGFVVVGVVGGGCGGVCVCVCMYECVCVCMYVCVCVCVCVFYRGDFWNITHLEERIILVDHIKIFLQEIVVEDERNLKKISLNSWLCY
jgi:hypothetical protein